MNKTNLKVFNFSSFFLVSMNLPFLSRKVTSAIIIIYITSVTDCRNKVTLEQRLQSYLAWYVINTLSLETFAQCRSMGYIPLWNHCQQKFRKALFHHVLIIIVSP